MGGGAQGAGSPPGSRCCRHFSATTCTSSPPSLYLIVDFVSVVLVSLRLQIIKIIADWLYFQIPISRLTIVLLLKTI